MTTQTRLVQAAAVAAGSALMLGQSGLALLNLERLLTPAAATTNATGTTNAASTTGTSDAAAGSAATQHAPTSGASVASTVQHRASTGVVLVDVVTTSGEGAGTGMVLTADGLVLTNYHVVEGSTLVRVTIPDADDAVYSATLVGHDADADVALLQLTGAHDLATVTLDTDGVTTGEAVTAIGNGEGAGYLQTVQGLVTGTDRSITVADESTGQAQQRSGLLETDAAIVPGYSGGPLLDAQGRVVGINTAGTTSSRVVDSYAVPIGTALAVVDVIESGTESGSVQIGPAAAVGVRVYSSVAASRRQLGGAQAGVLVADVTADGPAAEVGVTAGSTIVAVVDQSTPTTAALSAALARHDPGDVVALTWLDAAGATHTADVTLVASPVN